MSRRRGLVAWAMSVALLTSASVVPDAAAQGDPAPPVAPTAAALPIEAEHVAGQVVVHFAASMSDTAKATALSIARVETTPVARAGDAVVLQTEPGQSVESAIAVLRTRAAVRYA
jgi:hypothetical protein